MANSRTTYQDRSSGDGATASGDSFVWVSLRDPSAEELAALICVGLSRGFRRSGWL